MKISNISINIKIGNKKYSFKNLILNQYFKKIMSLYSAENSEDYFLTKYFYCCLKFNEKINFDEESEIKRSAFDIHERSYNDEIVSNKTIQTTRNYTFKANNLTNYSGNQLMTIGFYFSTGEKEIVAALDVSNNNIYIQEEEDICIQRVDKIQISDKWNCNYNYSSYKYPLHLHEEILKSQVLNQTTGQYTYKYDCSHLENIGYGYNKNKCEIWYDAKNILTYNDLDMYFINDNLGNDYIYPSDSLYPNDNLIPSVGKYKYIFLKYYIYEKTWENGIIENIKKLDQYYVYSIAVKTDNKYKFTLKYERGD